MSKIRKDFDADARNQRRLDLIAKKYSVGLTSEEADEYAGLKTWLNDEIARRCPRGDKLDEQIARIERIIARKRGPSDGS